MAEKSEYFVSQSFGVCTAYSLIARERETVSRLEQTIERYEPSKSQRREG